MFITNDMNQLIFNLRFNYERREENILWNQLCKLLKCYKDNKFSLELTANRLSEKNYVSLHAYQKTKLSNYFVNGLNEIF